MTPGKPQPHLRGKGKLLLFAISSSIFGSFNKVRVTLHLRDNRMIIYD